MLKLLKFFTIFPYNNKSINPKFNSLISSKKPLLIVAGFLGSGKTSLIRELLSDFTEQGVTADVILNDIANAELDAESINAKHAGSIIPLSASCACCESLEELLALCQTASKSEGDLLLLELNGTADPLVLLQNFWLLKDKLPFSSMIQICIIDVRHWGNREKLSPIEKRQMESSTLHFLSHTDQADTETILKVDNIIGNNFPKSRKVSKNQLADALIKSVQTPSKNPNELENLQVTNNEHSNSNMHDKVHLLSHQVKGIQLSLPSKVRRTAIENVLKKLPDEVLRAKALVKLVEEPGVRWIFEKAGTELSPTPTPVPNITHSSSSLLCVGLELEVKAITKLVIDEFGYHPEIQ